MRKLKEQQTEPLRITRLELEQSDISKRLGSVQEDVAILKVEMRGAKADISQIKESQVDLRDTLKGHGQRLKSVEEKQNVHTEVRNQLVDLCEDHTKRFDRVETTQAEHGTMLREILALLKQRPSE